MNLTAAALSQAAAAASSQAFAEGSSSADSGSQVGVLAQIIIAIGVLPVELIIVTIVLGIHRLVHPKRSRPLQTRVNGSVRPAQDSPPFLQPKAELEDEQKRRHELHGEHVVNELDGENAILQIADDTDSLILPLQGTQGLHEMPARHHLSSEMGARGRNETMGDVYARELECPSQQREESIRTEMTQELESPVRASYELMAIESAQELESSVPARDMPLPAEKAQDLATLGDDPVIDSASGSPSRSHFMLRQQQMANIDGSMATDQHNTSPL